MATADKRVNIGVKIDELGVDKSLQLLRVTEANISEEIDSQMVKTFDDPVSVPSNDGGFTVDLSMLEARNVNEYRTLKEILGYLKKYQGTLSIIETVKHKDGNFEQENHFSGVSLASNKVKFSATDLTARDVSFNAESMREYIDGEEVILKEE